MSVDSYGDDQEITMRQHVFESLVMRGCPWAFASEAVATTVIEWPDIDWELKRTRADWRSREIELS